MNPSLRVVSVGVFSLLCLACCQTGAVGKYDGLGWRSVARSHFIVVGRTHVPTEEVARACRAGGGMVEFVVEVEDVLKGHVPSNRLVVGEYVLSVKDDSLKWVMEADGSRAVWCLVELDAGYRTGLWLLDDRPVPSVQIASEDLLEEVRSEVKRQKTILATFDANRGDPNLGPRAEVKAIIDRLIRRDTARQALEDLHSLGSDAVPVLIDLVDDDRRLPFCDVELTWKELLPPDEGIHHTRFERVVDVVDFILQMKTKVNISTSLSPWRNEIGRRETINAWRIYLHHMQDAEGATTAK
jgi:hypothetical protein